MKKSIEILLFLVVCFWGVMIGYIVALVDDNLRYQVATDK